MVQWNFRTDEEIPLLELDDDWNFPIYISARLQLASLEEPNTTAAHDMSNGTC